MKLLPTDPAQRRRLIVMLVALALMAFAYYKWGGGPEYVIPKTTGPAAPSNRSVTQARSQSGGRPGSSGKAEPTMPQPLKLEALEPVPDSPEAAGRNLFRFGVPPPPPRPAFTPTPPPPPPVATPPPGPPPIPPVPLWLTTIITVDPPAKPRAYLHDKAGNTFEHVEGDVIDGRYKLLRVGTDDVVVSYLDGTGQRVLHRGG